MFRIEDIQFEIKEATLYFEIRHLEVAKAMWGNSNTGIAWFIEVEAQAPVFDEETWISCRFSLNTLTKWTGLEGASITVRDLLNEATEYPPGHIYVMGHRSFSNCHFSFGARKGNNFEFQWRGILDEFLSGYGANGRGADVPFEIATNIRFTTGTVYEVDVQTANRMLGEYLDLQDFVQREVNFYGDCGNGTPWGTVVFEPKPSS